MQLRSIIIVAVFNWTIRLGSQSAADQGISAATLNMRGENVMRTIILNVFITLGLVLATVGPAAAEQVAAPPPSDPSNFVTASATVKLSLRPSLSLGVYRGGGGRVWLVGARGERDACRRECGRNYQVCTSEAKEVAKRGEYIGLDGRPHTRYDVKKYNNLKGLCYNRDYLPCWRAC